MAGPDYGMSDAQADYDLAEQPEHPTEEEADEMEARRDEWKLQQADVESGR